MGIRTYIRNAIAESGGADEQSEESAEEGYSSSSGEFLRSSIVEGGRQNSQQREATEEDENGRY